MTVESPLASAPGLMVVIDVCVQKDVIGDDDDHVLVAESRSGSDAVLAQLQELLGARHATPMKSLVPFVCGVDLGAERMMKVADRDNATLRTEPPPWAIADELKGDAEYVHALRTVSSYAFWRSVRSSPPATSMGASPKQRNGPVDEAVLIRALELVRARSGASSLLVTGVVGSSQSTAKATAEVMGRFLIGMGVALATAGLGTGYYALYIPGHQIEGRLMYAALINLHSGTLTWANAIRAQGDPSKPEVIAEPGALRMLLKDVIFKVTPTLDP